MTTNETRVDVVAVSLADYRVLWVDENKAERNAEGIIGMAIARQGVSDRFFTTAPTGKYHTGDVYP